MNGELAGVLDTSGNAGAALARRSGSVRSGPLWLTAAPHGSLGDPVSCAIEGFLDNRRELAEMLGLPPALAPERVLAAGYHRWGADLPRRLRGDFAIVIWDPREGNGLIVRDQLGVRCVYLHRHAGALYFATEIRTLLSLLPSTPPPDPAGVAHWVCASNRPGSHTLYEGVRRLDPGSMLIIDDAGAREHAYWRPRFDSTPAAERGPISEQVSAALDRSVRRRVEGHQRVGVLMSGGLDSASVAALACAQAPRRVHAHAGVFPEHPAVDESGLIAELRRELALPGITAQVRPGGIVASAIEWAGFARLPLLGWGDFWTLPLLRAAASAGTRLSLGGDGGDELFGPRSYVIADAIRAGRPRQAITLARELPGAGDHPRRREVARVLATWGLGGVLPSGPQSALWRARARGDLPVWLLAGSARELIASDDPYAWRRLDGPRWWAHAAHGVTRGVEETGVFEHQRLRASIAGLQTRHPFFDLDLLGLALSIEPRASLDPHRSRPMLRAAMSGRLIDSVRLRPAKAWFDSLISDCLTGPDGRAVRALLTDRTSELGAYVDRKAVTGMLEDGPGTGIQRFRWMHHVWRLVSAECWLRTLAHADLHRVGASPPQVSLEPHG